MLAFALIVALTAHSALAKPVGNCIFMCEAQPGFSGASGAYTQPGFSGASGAYTQPGFSGAYSQPSFGQAASGFGQGGSSFGQSSFNNMFGSSGFGSMSHAKLEDFGTVPVQQQPAYQPMYSQPQQTEVVQQQIPVQPQIDGMFSHSSSKASYESNNGYLKIHQPGVSRTVISEPIRQQPMRVRPARICQDVYDPCV